MNHFFLRYLNLLYREFEGDLVLPIVLGEIAHHNIHRFYSLTGGCIEFNEKAATAPERIKHLEPTNAFSISQATGIPRETVRRKIDKLEKKGWVVKNDQGEVFMSETVSEHFTKDFNKKILAELLEASGCIWNLLKPA
jgi:predicted transcriptional regulator